MNFECNICMTNEVKPLSQLKCNHLFHSDCIDKWLKQSETCPYCREEFNDFNDIEKIKSEYKSLESDLKLKNELLKSKNRELRSECEEKTEEKELSTNTMKYLKREIEFF